MAASSLVRRPALGVLIACGVLGAAASGERRTPAKSSRERGLEAALGARGMVVDPDGIRFLEGPPLSPAAATAGRVPAIVRARPADGEPHDVYLVNTRLTPEGVLLGVGRAYNLTETALVDEQRPEVRGGRVAFVEKPTTDESSIERVRVFDLGADRTPEMAEWSRLERMQSSLTHLQREGRLPPLTRWSYTFDPPAKTARVKLGDTTLELEADARRASVAFATPNKTPDWLSAEVLPLRRPPKLINWAVDRVRHEIGDNSMQWIKAIAFSALDAAKSRKEELTGDTGEDDIAADLGEDALAPVQRQIPVDPQIGFPPPPLKQWLKRGLPGEGQWNGKVDDPFIHTLPGLPPTFVTTFIRSDKRRQATRVYIALWDPRVVQLNMMAGVAEPKSATGATGPGLIPREPAVLKRVAAAFNAGFQSLHGEFGMMGDGVVYLPPKPYAATVATMHDGSVAFGSWPNDPAIPDGMRSYRQNMTVLVQNKKFNPYKRTWWGGTPDNWEDKTHTVRTGICLTEERFVAYFYGADLSPRALAQAMIQCRCDYGIALDMNAGHSGLEWYRVAPEGGFAPLGRHLRRDWERTGKLRYLDGWTFRARRLIRGMGLMDFPRYIRREGRDFFYLTLRHVLPGSKLPGAKAWKTKGLPQHGFPYAVATAEATIGGAPARVLSIDPRMVTGAAKGAVEVDGKTPPVLQWLPGAAGPASLWFTPTAASVATAPPLAGAVRFASGAPLGSGKVPAAAGVQDEAGMVLYVEAASDAGLPGAALSKWFAKAGVREALGLPAPLPLALGGDTDLAGKGVRLKPGSEPGTLWRARSAGARRMFEDTPIVPFKEWYPLQARRIRYFKKKKKKSDS